MPVPVCRCENPGEASGAAGASGRGEHGGAHFCPVADVCTGSARRSNARCMVASRPRGVAATLPVLGVAQLLRLLRPRQPSCGLALSMPVAFPASRGAAQNVVSCHLLWYTRKSGARRISRGFSSETVTAPPPPPTPRGRPSSSQAENHTHADRLQNISAALSVPASSLVNPAPPPPRRATTRNLAHGQYKIDTPAATAPRGDDHAPPLRTATSAPGSERPRRASERTRGGARGRGGRHPGPLAPPTPPSPQSPPRGACRRRPPYRDFACAASSSSACGGGRGGGGGGSAAAKRGRRRLAGPSPHHTTPHTPHTHTTHHTPTPHATRHTPARPHARTCFDFATCSTMVTTKNRTCAQKGGVGRQQGGGGGGGKKAEKKADETETTRVCWICHLIIDLNL